MVVLAGPVVVPSPAWAEGTEAGKTAGKTAGKKRVALVPPTNAGADAASLARKMAKVLKAHDIEVIGGAKVRKAVANDAPSTDGQWTKLAAEFKVDAFIESTMSQTGTTDQLEVVVHNGVDGAIAGRETFSAKASPRKMAAEVSSHFWDKLGAAIQGTSAPAARDSETSAVGGKTSAGEEKVAAAEQKGAGKSEDEGDDVGAETPNVRRADAAEGGDEEGSNAGAGPRALEVELGLRMLRRVLQFTPAGTAAPYELKFVPLVGGQVTWHFIKYVGIFVRGEFTAALKSGIYPSATREIVVGGQGRYPFSKGQVHLNVAFFQHLFHILDTVSTADAPRSSLATPNVTYTGFRLGVGGRLSLGDRILVGAEGAYRLVTNPGEGPDQVRSPSYFPNGMVSLALDAGGFFGFRILDFLEARISADYRRYVFGMLTGPRLNVAGASDEYLAINLGVVGVLGGK